MCGFGGDEGQTGSEGPVIEPGAEHCGAQAGGGDAISVCLGDAFDEAVRAQSTEIIGHASGGILARLVPEQGSEMLADVLVSEGALDEDEEKEDLEQGVNPRVGEAQAGSAVAVNDDGPLHLMERSFADEAIVTDALDVEQTSIGREADDAELVEIFDTSADVEVASVIDGGFGSRGLAFLMLRLYPALLIVYVQRRGDALADDARAEATGCVAHDPAVEHQAHSAGAADIQVLADDFLEEQAPCDRLIEDLSERELGLQDRDLVAKACGTVAWRKRMRQAAKPFAQELIDLGGRETITQPLRQLGVGTRLDAVIEGLERHTALGQLALEVFVTVDGELGVVREVGAELQKEWAEVLIDGVEVVVIDHSRGLNDPRIGLSRLGAAAFLRPGDPRFLLGLADIENAFVSLEVPQVLLGDIVLALSLLEAHQIDALLRRELLDVADECLGHRSQRGGRCKGLAPVLAQVVDNASHSLQQLHIDVEVHPVDALEFQGHVITQDVGHRSCYGHRGLRSSTGPQTHRASSSYIQGMSLKARPESTATPRNPLCARDNINPRRPLRRIGLHRASALRRTVVSHAQARLRLRSTRDDGPVHTTTRLVGLRRSLAWNETAI